MAVDVGRAGVVGGDRQVRRAELVPALGVGAPAVGVAAGVLRLGLDGEAVHRQPGGLAVLRIVSMRSREASLGVPSGTHPSPSRAQRSSSAGAEPPNQIGIGSDGRGLMPARVDRWNSPSKSTTSSAHSRRISSTCSAWRRPRLVNVSLSLTYSTTFQPVPMPRRKRLPDSTASSAACLATSTVWRWGRISTAVTSSIVVVTAAMKAKERERLVERDVLVVGAFEAAGPVAVGAEHVVVDQQVGDAQLLEPLGVGDDRTGSVPISWWGRTAPICITVA